MHYFLLYTSTSNHSGSSQEDSLQPVTPNKFYQEEGGALVLYSHNKQNTKLTTSRGDYLVQELRTGSFPDCFNHSAKILIGFINVSLCLDLQRCPYQGK